MTTLLGQSERSWATDGRGWKWRPKSQSNRMASAKSRAFHCVSRSPASALGDLFSGQGVGDVVGVQRQKPERAGRCWRRRVLGEGRPNFTTSSTGDPSQQGGALEPTQPGSHAHSAALLCRGYRSKTQRKPPFLYFLGFFVCTLFLRRRNLPLRIRSPLRPVIRFSRLKSHV